MLKYSLKAHMTPELNKLSVRETYLSKDLSYISGVTDYFEGIRDGEEVSLSSPYVENKIQTKINLDLVRRQGYVITKERKSINSVDVIDYDEVKTVRYIEYNGNFYYEYANNGLKGFLIEGFFYRTNDETVTITVKNWIENGVVWIKGEKYRVDTNLIPNDDYKTGYEPPVIKKYGNDELLTTIDDNEISVKDYEYNKWFNCYKFLIKASDNNEIDVVSSTPAMYYPFIIYKNDVYDFFDYGEGNDTEYGVLVEGNFYKNDSFDSVEEYNYTDEATLKVGDEEVNIESLLKTNESAIYSVLKSKTDISTYKLYDIIIAESNYPYSELDVIDDTFVFFDNQKYLIKNNVGDYVTINNEDYKIEYTDSDLLSGKIVVNGNSIPLTFFNEEIVNEDTTSNEMKTIKKCYYTNKIYTKSGDSVIYSYQNESTDVSAYTVTEVDGIVIDDVVYPIYYTKDGTSKFCKLNKPEKYEFEIIDILGSDSLLLSPVVNNDDYVIKETVNRKLYKNLESFHFYLKNNIFGDDNITPEVAAVLAATSNRPISTKDVNLTLNKLAIYQISDYITLPISLGNKIGANVNADDVLQNEFVNEKTEEGVNSIVDMEKDVYYPGYYMGDGFAPITKLVFNLHFRTRNKDSWKINEDNTEELGGIPIKGYIKPFNSNGEISVDKKEIVNYGTNLANSNWFVIDNYYYDLYEDKLLLQNSSDLMGLLNFTDEDVKYRKNKIGKSFLRLSFYSTNNPHTQVLLSTSTIFMDENSLYKKYMDFSSNGNFINVNTNEITKNINVLSENYTNGNVIEIKTNKRLDSSITVNNKYSTNTSSEGFYLYLFRDYSTKLRENTIYLKIDFCHAGTGLVLPFIIPTNEEGTEPLYMDNYSDVELMKKGVAMTDLYNKMYIPIKVIYSEKDKKYFYYLPERFVENDKMGVENSTMLFNLFELKIKNQSYETDY